MGGVAAVGLGTGSLACHRHDGEAWTFFELDPHVVRIARDPALFRFLSACGTDVQIVLGDARLTLAASPERYDVIVLDAFSSDLIPVHLLTRQAFAGYLSRLTAHGVIVFHVSNRHMALQRPVAAVGSAEGLIFYLKTDDPPDKPGDELRTQAEVVVSLAICEISAICRRSRDGSAWHPIHAWRPGPTTMPTFSAPFSTASSAADQAPRQLRSMASASSTEAAAPPRGRYRRSAARDASGAGARGGGEMHQPHRLVRLCRRLDRRCR